eukprot:scaffold88058_cov60-Phaeocystis_antarctica.AAC.2
MGAEGLQPRGAGGSGALRTLTDHMCRHLSKDPLARTWQHLPVSGSHKRMVESNDALASTRLAPGLLLPVPVGLHLIV